ncbi:hypothetical protein [Streptomyces phaeochromogenes]|nr:hypothetical protein [Streptomyces phaeochromogenes]WRZ26446.1 hypothetical protein OG931_01195 [Streptomyces phaeochromogenes]
MLSPELHPGLSTAQKPGDQSGSAGAQGPNGRAKQRRKSRIHGLEV